MEQTKTIYYELANKKISRLFWQYALPAIIGTVVNTLYNIIDGVFIGHWVGNEALSGLGVILPVMNLAAAIGMLVGVGSASRISIALGAKDYQLAEKIVGASFILTLVLSGAALLIMLFFLKPLLMFVGASEVTYPYARDFLQIFLPGSLFLTLCFNFNNMMRACGYPFKAMITMFVSVIANIILAPIFIIVFGWGMKGAAIATTISMAISFCFVMQHFLTSKSTIRLRLKNIRLNWMMVKSIVPIGLSPFFIQIAASIIVVVMNAQSRRYAPSYGVTGDDAIAAYANSNRLIMLIVMIVVGLTQGMQPIIGYNFGARNFARVKETLFYTIKVATLFTFSGFLLSFLASETLVSIFSSDQGMIYLSGIALRDITLAFSVIGFQIVVTSFFQCIGMPKQAILLSLSRQILFSIPLLFIVPMFLGLQGVWLANPIADVMAAGVTAFLLFHQLRRFNKQGIM
ncbi:MATE family efflux transporter [Zophobihabitans entericus]|uniref:Multidrug export protein MepA n=1 Tax=Zophobihabitans entericus TaxID=1635327 RepID=A0A6G9ICM6_9GAMM|nr:MATE family efflux transporter [Zophobihabitans entericus]QIQ21986.1 MATE family efflux transporter [Zophobihabitans entericus]